MCTGIAAQRERKRERERERGREIDFLLFPRELGYIFADAIIVLTGLLS